MQYLDIVNKVIRESACEFDELTSATWTTAEAGRRIYPRIKENVADAWKTLQMDRNEWEFKTAYYSDMINPRLKFKNGERAGGAPPVGAIFAAADGSFTFTVAEVLLVSGDWVAGTAVGQMEFTVSTGLRPTIGTLYTETSPTTTGTFTYVEKGSYNFLETLPNLREEEWSSFVAFVSNQSSNPIMYIPWDNWLFTELEFTQGSQSTPLYVSKDYEGAVVFYPQCLIPFRLSFVYTTSPQILSAYSDVPAVMPEEYHQWIAWEALSSFALFDKNQDLYSYARKNADLYERRAERNFLPVPSWGRSQFNE